MRLASKKCCRMLSTLKCFSAESAGFAASSGTGITPYPYINGVGCLRERIVVGVVLWTFQCIQCDDHLISFEHFMKSGSMEGSPAAVAAIVVN